MLTEKAKEYSYLNQFILKLIMLAVLIMIFLIQSHIKYVFLSLIIFWIYSD